VSQFEDFEFASLEQAYNYRQAIARRIAPALSGNVLEVGAGIGQMLQEVHRAHPHLSLSAVEPNPRFHVQLQTRVPFAKIWRCTVSDLPPDLKFDSIYAINVLEHLSDDLEELQQWHSRLNPGGQLSLLVPARKELYSRIDQKFGHFRRYNKNELATLLKQAGFQIECLTYFHLTGYLAWLAAFKIGKVSRFNPNYVRLYDKYIIPVSLRLEKLSPFIGQSLIGRARKNQS
jgi:SAM-dependent methyltransferase